MVLIHGLGGSREIFTEVMAALGSGVRCVAIDLPDMGESGAWAAQSPGEIAVALQSFLRSRGIARAVVVGHSYGGLTAMEFAARFPSAVKALFVMASPAMGLSASMRTLVCGLVPQMNRFKRVTTRVVASRRGMRAFLIWLSGRLKSPAPHVVARYVAANSSPGILEALSGGLRAISAFTPPARTRR